jgi:hypothetical protein
MGVSLFENEQIELTNVAKKDECPARVAARAQNLIHKPKT